MQFIYVINTKVKVQVYSLCHKHQGQGRGVQFIYVINTKVKEQVCSLYMS